MSEWENGLPNVGDKCEVKHAGIDDFTKIEVFSDPVDLPDGKAFIVSSELMFPDESDNIGILYRIEDPNVTFRPIPKRKSQPGEVWLTNKGFDVLATDKNGYVYLDDSDEMPYGSSVRLKFGVLSERLVSFLAPNLEAYYEKKIARKLYETSQQVAKNTPCNIGFAIVDVIKPLLDEK